MSLRKGIYQHFKGNRYQLMELARHSETGEDYVVYRALYGERGIWVRPLAMFAETIEREGQTLQRFSLVEAEDSGDGH